MRKIVSVLALCFMALMLLSLVANNPQVQAKPIDKDKLIKEIMASEVILAAHWTEDYPEEGGWIFAALVRDSEKTNDALLYVSGYHPAGVASKTSTTFSGVSPVDLCYADLQLIAQTEMDFKVVYGNGTRTQAEHDVMVNWSIPIPSLQTLDLKNLEEQWIKGIWTCTTATIGIDIGGKAQHKFSTSDWAEIGFMSPQKAMTIGHWIINWPIEGGWIFAAAGQSKKSDDAWIYIAGYHPANTLGQSDPTLFEGLNTDVNMKTYGNNIYIQSAKVVFTQTGLAPATNGDSKVKHDVSLLSMKTMDLKGSAEWDRANAFITINTKGNWQHLALSMASFALIDIEPPNNHRNIRK